MALLDELLGRIGTLPPETLARLSKETMDATKHLKWIPNPGPQTDCYYCQADVTLYGGSGGGGKSDLLVGLGFTQHRRSLVMRRSYTDLAALTDRAIQINGSKAGYNGSPPPKLRSADGRLIEFGGCNNLGDEQHWQGRPHDFLGLDEAVQFQEAQARFLMGWVRSTDPKQRCRSILASNPPLTAEGQWIIGMFRPWLDITHPNPAMHGELRWFVTAPDGKHLEVDGPEPIELEGKTLIPKSYTFLPASLEDNPFLINTGYQRELDALPEPLRTAVRDGNFMAARKDDDFQVIPTAWIVEAQARWKEDGWKECTMTAMALDPAGGGRDSEELAYRHGGWYGRLVSHVGPQTADGSMAATTIIKHRRHGAAIVVDVGGGYGGAVMLRLKDNEIEFSAFNGTKPSSAHTNDGKLKFFNKRAEAWWKFREALDPSQEGGSPVGLPPDPELTADLSTPTWTMSVRGIQIESKDDIKKRLGRSPGKGDAVVMCLSEGNRAVMRGEIGIRGLNGRQPRVIMGHDAARRTTRR
jgi:hypothetical protein